MSTEEKIKAVQQSPQMIAAMELLIAAFHDCQLKSHMRFTYTVLGVKYEITFLPIHNEITYRPSEESKA